MMERLDTVTGPIEVGKFYLVPTVRGMWQDRVWDWPIIGPRHQDKQCLDFAHYHYHLDTRFLAGPDDDFYFWRSAFAAPLTLDAGGRLSEDPEYEGLPAPIWKRRKCRRLQNPFLQDLHDTAAKKVHQRKWGCHFDQWTGKQARRDGRGWVCPHRNVSLADHAVVDGVITCPLHLLRVDNSTGIVLPPIGRPE